MIYLDQAATSFPKPPAVVRAVNEFLCQVGANPGRSAHRLSLQAARLVFEARERLAKLFGAPDPRQLIFTSGATEAINLALYGLLSPGDHVVTTSMEHNAVARPLRHLQESRKVAWSVAAADSSGRIDPAAVRAALTSATRLVVVNHASNVVGFVQPIAAIKEAIGTVPLLVDAAQSAGAVSIDVERERIDLLAFCGHKFLLGPQGTGGLVLRPGLNPAPLVRGGTGSRSESDEQPDFLPDRYEAGSPNTPGIAGLRAAAGFLHDEGMDQVGSKLQRFARQLHDGLAGIPGVAVCGSESPDLPVCSFNVRDLDPAEVGRQLDQRFDILVRAGLHCAPMAHRTLGTFPRGTVRFSAGILNSPEDIDQALAAVRTIAEERS